MSEQQASGDRAEGSADSSSTSQTSSSGLTGVINHISLYKLDAALWMTRVATIFFSIFFILPLLGNPYEMYRKALIANAATSALRLHDRLSGSFTLSREFFGRMILEDSCHYLFFSLIFMTSAPITLVLVPIFLFALLHSATYTKQLLEKFGQTSFWPASQLNVLIQNHQQNILRIVACTEIFLMPATILMIFSGRGSLLMPFMYYRFLCMRYASRRNPYSRQLFYELRVTLQQLTYSPRCPGFVRTIADKGVAFVSRMAPQMTPQAQ